MAEKKQILVIDDVADIRETLRMLLEIEGYEVLLAANGKEGLDQLRAGACPGLILLDLSMPVMSGEEFLARRAEENVAARVPVVVFAAGRRKPNLEDAVAWVSKPVDRSSLVNIVERCYRPPPS